MKKPNITIKLEATKLPPRNIPLYLMNLNTKPGAMRHRADRRLKDARRSWRSEVY